MVIKDESTMKSTPLVKTTKTDDVLMVSKLEEVEETSSSTESPSDEESKGFIEKTFDALVDVGMKTGKAINDAIDKGVEFVDNLFDKSNDEKPVVSEYSNSEDTNSTVRIEPVKDRESFEVPTWSDEEINKIYESQGTDRITPEQQLINYNNNNNIDGNQDNRHLTPSDIAMINRYSTFHAEHGTLSDNKNAGKSQDEIASEYYRYHRSLQDTSNVPSNVVDKPQEPELELTSSDQNTVEETDYVNTISYINYGDESYPDLVATERSEVLDATPAGDDLLLVSEVSYEVKTTTSRTQLDEDNFWNPLTVSAENLSNQVIGYTGDSVKAEISELENLVRSQDYDFNYHMITDVTKSSQWKAAGDEWANRVSSNINDIVSNVETMGEDVLDRLAYMKSADFLVSAIKPGEILRSWTKDTKLSKSLTDFVGYDLVSVLSDPERFIADLLAKGNQYIDEGIKIAQDWVSKQFDKLKKKEVVKDEEVRVVKIQSIDGVKYSRNEETLRNYKGRSTLANFEFHDEAYWDIDITPYNNNPVPNINDYFPEGWVPILTYDLILDSVSTTDMDLMVGTNIPIPNATLRSPKLTLQMVDSSELGLFKFKKDFKRYLIPPSSGGVRGYEDSCYKLTITRFRPDWSLLDRISLIGIPEVVLMHQGTQEPTPNYQDLIFNIVGELEDSYSGYSIVDDADPFLRTDPYTKLPTKIFSSEEKLQ